jgi:hypothetical protein
MTRAKHALSNAEGTQRRQEQKIRSTKSEIRNNFQMTAMCKIPNRLHSDSVLWIFPSGDLFVSGFVSDFDIRI